MSTCTRCGATFGCAMAEGTDEPCWCTRLPPVVPVPGAPPAIAATATTATTARAGEATDYDAPPGCWCPACLERHIARRVEAAPGTDRAG